MSLRIEKRKKMSLRKEKKENTVKNRKEENDLKNRQEKKNELTKRKGRKCA